MMGIRIGFICMVMGCLIATAGSALEWRVEAHVFATEKPIFENYSIVRARGVHRLLLTSISLVDGLFPIRSKLTKGQLFWEGDQGGTCSTPWGFAAYGAVYHECRTQYTQDPCDDGLWASFTTGRVTLHPDGGTKLAASTPKLLNCTCT
jgi:hypothetical protein